MSVPASRDRRPRGSVLVLPLASLLAFSWLAMLFVAPAVATRRPGTPLWGAAAFAYVAGGRVCHQRAERSFHVAGVQQPVCARCAGLYAGGAAGLALGWWRARRGACVTRRFAPWVAALAAPSIATLLIEWGGVAVAGWMRAALGALLGGGVAMLVAGALAPGARDR